MILPTRNTKRGEPCVVLSDRLLHRCHPRDERSFAELSVLLLKGKCQSRSQNHRPSILIDAKYTDRSRVGRAVIDYIAMELSPTPFSLINFNRTECVH